MAVRILLVVLWLLLVLCAGAAVLPFVVPLAPVEVGADVGGPLAATISLILVCLLAVELVGLVVLATTFGVAALLEVLFLVAAEVLPLVIEVVVVAVAET